MLIGKIAHEDRRFKHRSRLAFLVVVFLFTSGCNLCCPPFLDDYATVGGKWSRANPTEGRVGSVFSDPGVTVASAEEGLAYPGIEVLDSNDSMSESGAIIEYEIEENAPMILGEDW